MTRWASGLMLVLCGLAAHAQPAAIPARIEQARPMATDRPVLSVPGRWTVRNDSDRPVVDVRHRTEGTADFGPNRLTGPLAPGQTAGLTHPSGQCQQQLEVRFADSSAPKRIAQNVCQQPVVRIPSDPPTPATLDERVKQVVALTLRVDAATITADTPFDSDLGADRLNSDMLAMALEAEFGVEIPDDVARTMRTVGDAVAVVRAAPRARPPAAARPRPPTINGSIAAIRPPAMPDPPSDAAALPPPRPPITLVPTPAPQPAPAVRPTRPEAAIPRDRPPTGSIAPASPAPAPPAKVPQPEAAPAPPTGLVYCPALEEEVPAIVCQRAMAVEQGVAGVKAKPEMVLGEMQTVSLAVSRSGNRQAVVDELGGPDAVFREFKLATGRYMEARLTADGGLEITPADWVRRDLGAGDLEDWTWQVKAVAEGRHQITLRTRVMKQQEDGRFIARPGRESEPQYVDVTITRGQEIEQQIGIVTRWMNALTAPTASLTNLLTLLTTLLVAAGGLWAAIRGFGRGRRKDGVPPEG